MAACATAKLSNRVEGLVSVETLGRQGASKVWLTET